MNASDASGDTSSSLSSTGQGAQVFLAFLHLGLTSFGGPLAHMGYFHAEFVRRRQWLDDTQFASWLALCQFLPGPASSQMGLLLGYARAGYAGAALAWLGFTLPSALLLYALALGLHGPLAVPVQVLHMLKILAVAVVAHALLGMMRSLGKSFAAWLIMTGTCALALVLPNAWVHLAWLLVCAVLGRVCCMPCLTPRQADAARSTSLVDKASTATLMTGLRCGGGEYERETSVPAIALARCLPRPALVCGLLFALLLLALPLVHHWADAPLWAVADVFYRTGALVFGGGHTVLPWLQWELVQGGHVEAQDFLAGYSLAQAVPGPLFTFAAFLGAVTQGYAGAVVALLCIFLPGTLLVFAALPVWTRMQQSAPMRSALQGVQAAVMGLLAAAFYQPIWISSIQSPAALLLAGTGFVALHLKMPAWALVLVFVALGAGMHLGGVAPGGV